LAESREIDQRIDSLRKCPLHDEELREQRVTTKAWPVGSAIVGPFLEASKTAFPLCHTEHIVTENKVWGYFYSDERACSACLRAREKWLEGYTSNNPVSEKTIGACTVEEVYRHLEKMKVYILYGDIGERYVVVGWVTGNDALFNTISEELIKRYISPQGRHNLGLWTIDVPVKSIYLAQRILREFQKTNPELKVAEEEK
jgi:hypothetical protein